ncbi:MAG TPA: helix-turn-helix domain-containing protein [Gemmatimonadales bacterium]|nr:helix-turn-helix domain-containing protein [Gemmatimonadales bacterium]
MSGELTLTLPDALVEQIAQRAAELVLAQLAAPDVSSPYLTIPEAAEVLRCKRQRIDDLLSARKLTRVKEGRRTLILRAELEQYLQREHERQNAERERGAGGSHSTPTGLPQAAHHRRRGDSLSSRTRATVANPR